MGAQEEIRRYGCMTNDTREAFRDAFLHRICGGWTGRLYRGSRSCIIFGENPSSKLADFRISFTKFLNTYRRRRCYQSTSAICQTDWISTNLFRRRSQLIMLGFPSPFFDIRYWLFLDQTLWLQKEKNGRSTGRSLPQHSQRYVLSSVRHLMLSTIAREIINWCGTRLPGLSMTCSTMSGVTGPKLLWITVWISPFQYVSCSPAFFLSPDSSARWPSSLLVLQVDYAPFQPSSLMTAETGFGRRVTWTSDLVIPPGHQMTFKDALHISSTNLFQTILFPNWAKYLTKHTRKVDLAFTELKVRYSKLSKLCSCHPYHLPRLAIYVGNGGSSQECG